MIQTLGRVGGNYKGEFGGANIAVSLGHYQASQTQPRTYDVKARIRRQISRPMRAVDDKTFTNFGLQVGFGAFGFDVAYAENDGGEYMADGKKNGAKDWETVSAGVMYSDGPMAVSLSHMATEDGDSGTDKNATMLSMSYSLAPGVDSKTSIFGTEADRSGSDKSHSKARRSSPASSSASDRSPQRPNRSRQTHRRFLNHEDEKDAAGAFGRSTCPVAGARRLRRRR